MTPVTPSAGRPIGAMRRYILGSHITLVLAAVGIPAAAALGGEDTLHGLLVTALVGCLSVGGALSLWSEHHPDHAVSRSWCHPVASAGWATAMMVGTALLLGLTAPAAGGLAVVAVALTLRAVAGTSLRLRAAAGVSLWSGSARAAVATVAVLGMVHLLPTGTTLDEVSRFVAFGALLALAVLGQDAVYALALEVDDLRSTESQRAIHQERQRFAGDLHDIQGQHLQLLVVEAELVQRLLDAGHLDQARARAAHLGTIAASALEDMRKVAHGYRQVSVATEIDNAAAVLDAAGISAVVDTDLAGPLPDDVDRLLGLSIREAITNTLRHSRATSAALSIRPETRTAEGRQVAGVGLVVTDSGPATADHPTSPGEGLSSLRGRYARAGGVLDVTISTEAGTRLHGWIPVEAHP